MHIGVFLFLAQKHADNQEILPKEQMMQITSTYYFTVTDLFIV
jgi:hypothetical protein